MLGAIALLTLSGLGQAAYLDRKQATSTTASSSSSTVPQHFQISPEIWAGMFLARNAGESLLMVSRPNCYWSGSFPGPEQPCAVWSIGFIHAQPAVRDCSSHSGRHQQCEHLPAYGQPEPVLP